MAESKVEKKARAKAALAVRMELYREECKEAGREIMFNGARLRSSADRVKICHWLKKLSELRTDKVEPLRMKHEYLQYLRVTLQPEYKVLTKPFNDFPPDTVVPFAEMIANKTADAIPGVPRAGILQPILCHKSGDDRAFMCVKRTSDNGILCYMAVAPDASAIQHGNE